MKTFKEFSKDMGTALTNLVAEAEGFAAKKKQKKRRKYLSARTAKIKALRDNPDSWKGLK